MSRQTLVRLNLKMGRLLALAISLLLLNCIVALLAAMLLREVAAPGISPGIIILRYDDYDIYDSYAGAAEKQFFDNVLANHIKVNFAIVPFPLQDGEVDQVGPKPERLKPLQQGLREDLFELCLHGYTHRNNFVREALSEFTGLPVSVQRKWIRLGKERLVNFTGAGISTFVPPFNGWDDKTLIALTENGFVALSAEADKFPEKIPPYYYPYTTTPHDLLFLLNSNSLDKSRIIVLVIHPHDLTREYRPFLGVKGVLNLLEKIRDADSKLSTMTYKEAISQGKVFSFADIKEFAHLFKWINFWRNVPLVGRIIKTKALSAYRPLYSHPGLYLLMIVWGINCLLIGYCLATVTGNILTVKFPILRYFVFGLSALVLVVIAISSFQLLSYGQIVAAKRYALLFLLSGWSAGGFFLKRNQLA